MPDQNLERAETLERFYQTLEPEPLSDAALLKAFYYAGLNEARGEDNVPRLEHALNRAHGGRFFRAFLAGHSGCGKSTELARLAQDVAPKFKAVRFSAKEELHPSSAKPFDVLILMMIRLSEELSDLGWTPPESLSRRTLDWFGRETSSVKTTTDTSATIAAGAGLDAASLWAKALGLFASLKGEVKFASARQKELVEYRMSRLSELIDLVNAFFDECNGILKAKTGQEWLFLGEDFEKLLESRLPYTFFVTESAVFSQLRTHLIFTIPVDLAWAAGRVRLPFDVYPIHDTPVYT